MKYELHPLCTLFPRLNGAEFEALKEDIKTNGLRQPIVIHEGMILDGGNRYRACIEVGIEPVFIDHTGDISNITAFVLSANLHRRHMTPGQQAAIVASAQDWSKAYERGGDRKSDQSATLHFDTVERRAAESGASLRTQKMADKVVKADPELAKKVAHGEITLPKAIKSISPKKEKQELKVVESDFQEEFDYDPEQDRINELSSTINDLQEENEKLRSALAINQIPEGLEIEDADTIIDTLRARVKQLEIEVKAITQSRDTYLRENSQLKEQIRRQAAQLKKLGVKASA